MISRLCSFIIDDSRIPSPETFNPDRFVGKSNLSGSESVMKDGPKDVGFGFGRRLCPGMYIAEAMFWTAVTFILDLATFDILPPLDSDSGEPIMPKAKFIVGASRCVVGGHLMPVQ